MNKVIIGILIAACAVAFSLLIKIQCNNAALANTNSKLQETLMTQNLELGRAHTQFGEAQDQIGKLEQRIQDEINTRDALLTRYGELEAKLEQAVVPKPVKTIVKYVEGPPIEIQQDLISGLLYQAVAIHTLSPIDKLKGTYKDHRLDISCLIQPSPGELDIPILIGYNLTLRLKGVYAETITPEGAVNNYVTLYEVDKEGNEIKKLELEKFEMVVTDLRSSQFFWWAPHVSIGAYIGYQTREKPSLGGSLGISLMGYGLTENDLSWRFLQLSFDISETIGFGIDPVMYNLGGPIPLISNLWISPHIGVDIEGFFTFGLAIGAVI